MARLFSPVVPKTILSSYFALLTNTGYAKSNIVFRMLAYVFILDMLKYCANYVTEKDYRILQACLMLLFKNGGCLFTYPIYCQNRAILGKDMIMGDVSFLLRENGGFALTEATKLLRNEDLTAE